MSHRCLPALPVRWETGVFSQTTGDAPANLGPRNGGAEVKLRVGLEGKGCHVRGQSAEASTATGHHTCVLLCRCRLVSLAILRRKVRREQWYSTDLLRRNLGKPVERV
eukprot:symbB.v1.2.029844.t1/scaffold3309.1/size59309/1